MNGKKNYLNKVSIMLFHVFLYFILFTFIFEDSFVFWCWCMTLLII